MTIPTIGRIVHYTLTDEQAKQVNKRRTDAHASGLHNNTAGLSVHFGNSVAGGDVFPLLITRVWGPSETSAVNGQVFLDGNDPLWVMSTSVGDGPGRFTWPNTAVPATAFLEAK